MSGPSTLLTPEDVAALLKVPLNTVYAWRTTRKGPPGIKVGKHLRYRPADVDRWLEELAQEQE